MVAGQIQVEGESSNFTRTLTTRLLTRNDVMTLTLKGNAMEFSYPNLDHYGQNL